MKFRVWVKSQVPGGRVQVESRVPKIGPKWVTSPSPGLEYYNTATYPPTHWLPSISLLNIRTLHKDSSNFDLLVALESQHLKWWPGSGECPRWICQIWFWYIQKLLRYDPISCLAAFSPISIDCNWWTLLNLQNLSKFLIDIGLTIVCAVLHADW